MSRKFSWHRSRYYSSEGLEVVPAEGIEIGFPRQLKPLPEPPEKTPKLYDKTLKGLAKCTKTVGNKVRDFRKVGEVGEARGDMEVGEEREGTEQTPTSKGWLLRKRILGVPMIWLVVGLVIFGFGLGIGGWVASMIMAGKRGGQVVVSGPSTSSSGASPLIESAVQTITSSTSSISTPEVTSHSFITSTRSAPAVTSHTTTSTGRGAGSTKMASSATVAVSTG